MAVEIITDEELATARMKGDFRLRGTDMTRLETFCDAAFAFATTMLVISIDVIPSTKADLYAVLKGAPAFAAAFASIMMFWVGHRAWSRRYGLEDWLTTLLSLTQVLVILILIYPLKLVTSTFFHWVTAGWLPSEYDVSNPADLLPLFTIYGIGFGTLSGLQALLYLRAARAHAALKLNPVERLRTREDVWGWTFITCVGFASALWAGLMPKWVAMFAGFVYCTIAIGMPIIATKHQKQIDALKEG